MAGLFPGICNSQNVDANGKPLTQAVLSVYAGGTLNLASVYQDIGLAIAGQNPMTADLTGRLPIFYVADGTYRVRLLDKYGVTVFDYLQVASIGASSSGGGGTAVDPTTVFQTGDCMWLDVVGLRTGWVRDNGRTIGSATSGASERANADCLALHAFLWNNFPDTVCPVVGGRGASAAADWAANKQITLPDKRGRGPFGVDDMGNTDANRLAGVPFTYGSRLTAGGLGGEATHTLATAEIPVITPSGTVALSCGGTPPNAVPDSSAVASSDTAAGYGVYPNSDFQRVTATFTGNSFGGGQAHNSMPLFVLGTFYRKL